MTIKKLLLFVFLAIPVQILAADKLSPVAHFTATDNKLDLQPYIEILADPDHRLSINDIVSGEAGHDFKPVSVIGSNFGFSNAVYWVRFTARFSNMQNNNVLLQLESPLIDNVSLFVADEQGIYHEKLAGDGISFAMREVSYRSSVFVLPEPGEHSSIYYMRLQTEGSMQIGLWLWTATSFIEHVNQVNLILGVYYGMLLLIVIAALLSYGKFNDKLFLYYALFLVSYLLLQLSLNGLSYQYLWPDMPWLSNRAISLLIGLTVISGVLFSGSFLQIWHKRHLNIKILFYLLITFTAISSMLSLFGNYFLAVRLAVFSGLLFPPVILIGAIAAAYAGYRPARIFIIACGIFLLAVLITMLVYLGIVPHTFFTLHAMQFGVMLVAVLFAQAFMERVELLRKEKEIALEKASTYLYQLNDGLETQVEKRTKQLIESEAQLRTLIETLPDIVWWKDPAGVYMGCNSKFERFSGASQAKIVGKTDYDFVDKKLANLFAEKDWMAIETGAAITYEEEVTFADDGHVELLETTKVPMFSPEGILTGVLGVGRNITEHRRSEQAMLNTQKMEAIGHLTGGIAHDFNNILAIIIGNLTMLKNQLVADESACKRIGIIQKSTQRAVDLVRQLLSFSHNKADQQMVTDINQLLNDMDSLIVHSVTPRIEVKLELASDLWLTRVDPGDLQDAVINLILNARDAMPGGGQLILKTMNCANLEMSDILCAGEEGGDYVQLAVIDNGEGIPSAQQAHIFEPFYTTKEQGKGTGLGLAMVFGFVKRSGGCLVVESEVGNGSKFLMNLPKCNGRVQINQTTETDIMDEKHRGSETILVVDDEEALLELASEILQEMDYRVLTATNGKQALQVLSDEPKIDLLLSDVLMPGGINGYELAERAVEMNPQLKVLLASGYTSSSEVHHSQTRFSANMLAKPYNLSLLAKRVRQLLDG